MRKLKHLSLLLLLPACVPEYTFPSLENTGCPDVTYPAAAQSPYSIPFPVGTTVQTGLANCSGSFHSAGLPDQFATDFDQLEGSYFVAARAGVVSLVQEDQPSYGGGNSTRFAGNAVFVEHGDGTTAIYAHSPFEGILVDVGDTVAVGDTLGLVGASGLAGYPHLHFIVVSGGTGWPYNGVPISFRNAEPADVPLESNAQYQVGPATARSSGGPGAP